MADLPEDGTLVVMCGDTPLLRAETLTALLDAHKENLATVGVSLLKTQRPMDESSEISLDKSTNC